MDSDERLLRELRRAREEKQNKGSFDKIEDNLSIIRKDNPVKVEKFKNINMLLSSITIVGGSLIYIILWWNSVNNELEAIDDYHSVIDNRITSIENNLVNTLERYSERIEKIERDVRDYVIERRGIDLDYIEQLRSTEISLDRRLFLVERELDYIKRSLEQASDFGDEDLAGIILRVIQLEQYVNELITE